MQGTGEIIFDDNIIDDPDYQQNLMTSYILGANKNNDNENVTNSEIGSSNEIS